MFYNHLTNIKEEKFFFIQLMIDKQPEISDEISELFQDCRLPKPNLRRRFSQHYD